MGPRGETLNAANSPLALRSAGMDKIGGSASFLVKEVVYAKEILRNFCSMPAAAVDSSQMSNKSHLDRDVGCVFGFLSIYRGNAMFGSVRVVEIRSPLKTRRESGQGWGTSLKKRPRERHCTRPAVGRSGGREGQIPC